MRKPPIVCLCGSTRFKEAFIEANRRFTLEGHIVLSVGLFVHLEGLDMVGETKKALDDLHLRKIDLADMVYVLNVGGYIGESTAKEIAYAQDQGKPLTFLEPYGHLTVTAPPEAVLWRAKEAAINELKPNEYDALCEETGLTNEEFEAGVDDILLQAGVRVIIGEKI